jgi:pyruvate kinase
MDAIIREAEAHLDEWGNWTDVSELEAAQDETFYICRAARELARDRNVNAIAVFTVSGRTALILSKYRPQVPILAFTPSLATYRKMNLYWGVIPHLVEPVSTIDAMLVEVDHAILKHERVSPGEQVVVICGYPVEQTRPTNLALLHTVGNS